MIKIKNTFTLSDFITVLRRIETEFSSIIYNDDTDGSIYVPKSSVIHLIPNNTEEMVSIIKRTVFVIEPKGSVENGVMINESNVKLTHDFLKYLETNSSKELLELEYQSDTLIKIITASREKYINTL